MAVIKKPSFYSVGNIGNINNTSNMNNIFEPGTLEDLARNFKGNEINSKINVKAKIADAGGSVFGYNRSKVRNFGLPF